MKNNDKNNRKVIKNNTKSGRKPTKNTKVVKFKNNMNVSNKISYAKIKICLAFMLIIFVLLIVRIWWLQFADGNKLQRKAAQQQTYIDTISAKRGSIYDSTGVILATSYEADNIIVQPTKLSEENRSLVAAGLSSLLELNYDEILANLNSSSKRVTVAKNITHEKVDQIRSWIKENKLSDCVSTEATIVRYYPYSSLASNVIGFCGTDSQGLSGIEYSWDSILTGTSGKSITSKDALQSQIPNTEETYIPAENGYNLTLTIDVNIQNIVEKYLKQAVIDNDCSRGGTAIVMEPSTGDILAMASYPDYNLNSPFTPNEYLLEGWDELSSFDKSNALQKMWNNECLTDTYEPGSVFKTITSAIALEEDIVNVDIAGTLYCDGIEEVADREIKCWRAVPHYSQSLRDAFNNSCNPAFIQLGSRIGAQTSYKYYEAFGFFNKTEISLPGESTGIFFNLKDVGPVQLATMSFGQRFTITPLQMINSVSAIVNDGVLMKPRIVKSITNTDSGDITEIAPTEVRQVVSKETSETIISMMQSEVEIGTGKKAIVKGYNVGGKTGTSEPAPGHEDEGYVASFIGIAPIEDVKMVVLVALYDPRGPSHQGGQIATPVVANIFAEALPYLGIPANAEGSSHTNNTSDVNLY
ncbi:MAG: hypothetical protein HFJ48_03980 [Clostridia bacterium]|nr:hypothetical protein [Clostridia bacterium]